jgi:hypothetical protein
VNSQFNNFQKTIFLSILLFGFFGLAKSSLAADFYVGQSGSGSTGTSACSDPYAVSWFNTSGNWANPKVSGKVGPGDMVHLCGIFTGSGGSTMLTAQNSGSAGNVITILFETGAKLSAPYWSGSNGALNIANKNYLVVDGGTDGVIEATANGTALANKQTSRGIVASGSTFSTVKNIAISNMYVHDNVANSNDTAPDQTNINAVAFLNANNFTIDNIVAHDAGWALNGWGNNITISNCDISNIDHGVAFGPSGTVSGINIFGNHFHNYVNWDTTSNSFHHDGIHMWGGLQAGGAATDRVNGANIYNNTFDGDSGVNITAHIFLEEQIQNVNIFNNTIIVPANRTMNAVWLEGRSDAGDSYASGHGVSNAVYNNYVKAGQVSGGGAALFTRYQDSVSVKNNILVGGGTSISLQNGTTIATSGINSNVYAVMGSGNSFGWAGSLDTDNFATWQNALPAGSGQDSNSWAGILANIKVNANGTLQTGSPAIGAGANLTSLGITALNSDKSAASRPSTGAWDIGAFEYSSGGGDTTPPAAPSGLAVN